MLKPYLFFAVILFAVSSLTGANNDEYRERRSRAAREFHDGILLLHAESTTSTTADGLRQDPYFYYFTGLENTVGAIFAVDGQSGQSWLFLPTKQVASTYDIK